MAKIVPLPTRAFGAEPGQPDVPALAGWIADHRGTAADLLAYLLDRSLAPQLEAGITDPCAGGLFCRDRVLGQLTGLNKKQDTATGEIDTEGTALAEDAAMLAAQKKNVWCALPAPHTLGITDAYYDDEGEWGEALADAYRRIMRDMRDAGIGGHVLVCKQADEEEIAALARPNVFFFVPGATKVDLGTLMECQRVVAVTPARLSDVFDLANEYELHRLIVTDPDNDAIRQALSHLDPDQVTVGGYCTDAEDPDAYWAALVKSAVYHK